MQAANRSANLNEQAQRQAVQQQAAMSGQRGGGLAMMGALAAQQSGANRAASQAADLGQARIAARQNAVGMVNQAGSNLADQGFQRSQARGSAIDQFNQAMLGNQQSLQQQNFANQLGASQNYVQAAQNAATYNQNAADSARRRGNSRLNFFLNPMQGMK